MIRIFLAFLMLLLTVNARAVDMYNAIATAYVTTTISQNVVFNSTMQQGGTFTFSVLAHNGGGRAGQSDTANVKIQFYTSNGTLVSSVNSSYSANLTQPTASGAGGLSGNPQADPNVPWSTLTISSVNCGGSCANVAYAKISMYGVDGSFWAGDYGPWYRAPTFTLNGGGNMAYNPEFGPYNSVNAQGWTTSPAMGACQGAWGGSNPCIVNSSGTPGTSTVGLVANQNGGGPDANGGTTSGTAGGYNSTMTTSNASGAPPAPTVTSTSVTYSTRNSTSGNTTQVFRTPTTTSNWSDGTTTTSTGSESLYQTRVNTTVVTNKIVNGTLTTITTPITKVTAAATNTTTVESNGSATSTAQVVNEGLNAEVFRYDPKNYNCLFGICAWNLTYHTPSTDRASYGNPVNTYRTTNGMFFATNSDLPNNDSGLGSNDGTVIRFRGTITAPITTAHPAGTVYRLYFYNNSDDGFKLDINGGNVINQNDTTRYQTIASYTSSGYMDVVAGQTYNLESWYWNTWGAFGHTLYWDYGDGMRTIPNTAFTDGVIDDIVIDTTGVSYSNSNVVDVSGSNVTPTIVSTSTSDSVTTSSTSSNSSNVNADVSSNSGGTFSTTTNTYSSTTTVTTTTTTPVTTTTWSDGSTTSSNGTPTSSTDTTYTINTTLGTAPIYSAASPNTNGNSVYIKQTSAWTNTNVSVTQDGNNNAVTGIQSGWAVVDGNNSNITTKQYGQGNIIGINMNAWGNSINLNQGSTSADANNNILMFDSHGNGNSATINQLTNSNSASIKLTSDINTVNLTQQTGTLNKSYITVNGNWNTVNNTQSGSGNFALINISGDNNTATVSQTGSNHSTLLNLINAGGANTVSVIQTGVGDSYGLQQTCTNPAGCSVSVVRNK